MLVHRISGRLKLKIQKMDTNKQTNPGYSGGQGVKNQKSHPIAGIMTGMLLLPPLKTNGYHHKHQESILTVH